VTAKKRYPTPGNPKPVSHLHGKTHARSISPQISPWSLPAMSSGKRSIFSGRTGGELYETQKSLTWCKGSASNYLAHEHEGMKPGNHVQEAEAYSPIVAPGPALAAHASL
jgi:hypothetical protein